MLSLLGSSQKEEPGSPLTIFISNKPAHAEQVYTRIVLALKGGGGGIGGDGGADKIIAFFFDGVLLSQKTHRLLLASVLQFHGVNQGNRLRQAIADGLHSAVEYFCPKIPLLCHNYIMFL